VACSVVYKSLSSIPKLYSIEKFTEIACVFVAVMMMMMIIIIIMNI
jgi:hypothetical protein